MNGIPCENHNASICYVGHNFSFWMFKSVMDIATTLLWKVKC